MPIYCKKELVEAIQWTGNNLAEVKEFLGEFAISLNTDKNNYLHIEEEPGDECIQIRSGGYIGKAPLGLFPWAQSTFEKEYVLQEEAQDG